jgi:hypothetical protein
MTETDDTRRISAATATESPTVSPAEDRDRQIAAAAWILGWIGGPVPAIAMLAIVDSPRWSRRLIVAAALFWAAMWAVFGGLAYVAVAGDFTVFAGLWIAAVLVAFAGTLLGAWAAFRASAERPTRRSW